MTTNKITIIGTIVAVFLIIFGATAYKVMKNYNNNLLKVSEDKIVNAAKKCYYDEKCTKKKVTLQELYDLNYLNKISNPITKEYYNTDSYVEIKKNKFKFVVVE